MRFLAALASSLLAAACASSGAPSAGPPRGGLSAADRTDPVRAVDRVGEPDSITTEAAKALFGEPDVERHDGAGAVLTWRTSTCALALAFGADRAGTLRLGATAIGHRDQHAPPPPTELCVREALARRAS